MRKSFLNLEKANRSSIQYRLMLVEFLIVVLPLFALAYVLYDRRVTFESSHLWIIALILLLVLCGMLILRQIINRILSVVVMVRPTETGIVQATLRDDLSEIHELEQAFGGLVGRLEKTTADLNRRSAEFLALKELVDVAKASLDLHNLQELTLDKVMSVTGARIASFLTVNPSKNQFRIAAARGIAATPQQDIDLPLENSPIRLAVSERRAVLVEDIEADPRIGRPNNPRYGSPSFICMPILAGNEVSAVINLAGKPAGEVFNEDDEKITSIMLREIKFAFENARLHFKIKEQLKQIEEKNIALRKEIEEREKAVSRLRECEDQLKDMVVERTAKLATTNRQLQQEVRVRQEVESALWMGEERLRTIVDSAKDWIFIKDGEGRYESVNAGMLRDLGLDSAGIVGRTAVDIFGPEQGREMRERDNAVFGGVSVEYETALNLRGTKAFFNIIKVPIRDADGRIVSLCGIARNITERKKLEARYVDAQKMEAIGTLAGGLAHDFNNLLMGIQGYTSLIMMNIDKDSPQIERLKAIEQMIVSGTNLTRRLLGVAKGRDHVVQSIDVNAVVAETAALFGRTKKEIRISSRFSPGLPAVDADSGEIEQILLNLFVNAWQAMPGGGELCLETAEEMLDEQETAPHFLKPGAYVKITVRDTGTGMDEETLARIFEPFFTTKERGIGTGLGLTTVYGIVKGHRGFLRVDSQKGSGTTFHIYLPVSAKPVREVRTEEEGILTGNGTILLVDDEDVILNVTRDMLESLGYRVITTASGREALDVYRRNMGGIDLVILDVVMPGMGGGETMSRLKSMDPEIRILFSSGYGNDGFLQKEIGGGTAEFIQKPFRLDDLSRRVREILDGSPKTAGAS